MKNALIALCAITVIAVCASSCYDMFFRPSEEVVTTYVVRYGDTMYDICNDTYISEKNAESFEEFLHKNLKINGSRILAGQKVKIVNRLWVK